MDEFFRSVGSQFAQQRSDEGRAGLIAGIACGLLLLAWVSARIVRGLRERRALRDFAARHSIAAAELALAAALAKSLRLETLAMLGQIDLFELATGKALAGPGAEAKADSLGKLRRALGYDRLPDYEPLHTSRELAAGSELRVGKSGGKVASSTELALVIQLRGASAAKPGEGVAIELPHAREAPYRLHCKLLEASAGPDGQSRLTLAHDEAPTRLQSRELRAPVRGAISLRPAFAEPGEEPAAREQTAELLEASAHELLVSSALKLAPGRQLECAFTLGAEPFRGVRAVVRADDGPLHDGPAHSGHRARLELRGLADHERERLRQALEETA